MVVAPTDNYHKIDCPTVFQAGDSWFMTYVVYNGKEGLDGRGYERHGLPKAMTWYTGRHWDASCLIRMTAGT